MCTTGKGATAKDRAAMAEEYNARAMIGGACLQVRYYNTIDT